MRLNPIELDWPRQVTWGNGGKMIAIVDEETQWEQVGCPDDALLTKQLLSVKSLSTSLQSTGKLILSKKGKDYLIAEYNPNGTLEVYCRPTWRLGASIY